MISILKTYISTSVSLLHDFFNFQSKLDDILFEIIIYQFKVVIIKKSRTCGGK